MNVDLARWQFAFVTINHFFFVPVTIGLAFLTALLQTAWYRSKREEYLRMGVHEYWILDPAERKLHVLQRAGDVWDEVVVPVGAVYKTRLLPGLDVRPEELLGPAEET